MGYTDNSKDTPGTPEETETASEFVAHQQEPPPEFRDVEATKPKETKVSYMSLPHKNQLAILCLARLADPLATSSIQVELPHLWLRIDSDLTIGIYVLSTRFL